MFNVASTPFTFTTIPPHAHLKALFVEMSDSDKPIPISPPIDLKTRRITLFSFWSIFLLLGVPLWWKTTSLEQNTLPQQRISEWDQYTREKLGGSATPSQVKDGRVVKYSPHYKLVFSLMNQNSSSSPPLSWDIDQLLHQHFKPLLSSVSPLHNFTIESQIQYYSPLTIILDRDSDDSSSSNTASWIKEQDVKAFVNNAEWNLASGTTLDPVLHFILYVPSQENLPMKIKTSQGSSATSFITPQRGGLVIFNTPNSSNYTSMNSDDDPLSLSFQTFSQQLQLLLGLPLSSSSSSTITRTREIENLILMRMEESLQDTTSSLINLLKTITDDDQLASNVSIRVKVQERVLKALDLLDTARDCQTSSSTPCSISSQLSLISQAQSLATKAYFDPSLLPMLYFPQEHKYAVYTPLFGPVSVPLIVGLVRELKEWRKRRREEKEKVA
ncbi:hypothetical protein JCM3765_002924 [Sporobolomyces pararoseus]